VERDKPSRFSWPSLKSKPGLLTDKRVGVTAYQTKSFFFILFLCWHFVIKKHASIILKNGNKQICGKKN
jgi:hypothetical protein